jgi:mono/diheme cytochrome c family protein
MTRRTGLAAVAATALLVGVSGCELKDDGDNLVSGKQNFVAKCGSCHVLKRAGTTGVTGPNLDEAFQRARADGFGQSTFKGVVYRQILQPARTTQTDPRTGKPTAEMPAKIFTGEDAQDVAAYVATAVAKAGEDPGQLATVGVKRSNKVAKAESGKLAIPADPSGGLAYTFGSAEAPAGALEIDSKNESSVDHNIAVEGNGVSEIGPVVKNGGVSKVSADLKAGEYVFFCSVPGHRQGGMEGKLTVK